MLENDPRAEKQLLPVQKDKGASSEWALLQNQIFLGVLGSLVTPRSETQGLLSTLQDAGVRIPEDIAIIGYDDIPEASIIRPMLTTIEQNSADIGYKLVNQLFERIENPDLPSRRIPTSNRLIIRNST